MLYYSKWLFISCNKIYTSIERRDGPFPSLSGASSHQQWPVLHHPQSPTPPSPIYEKNGEISHEYFLNTYKPIDINFWEKLVQKSKELFSEWPVMNFNANIDSDPCNEFLMKVSFRKKLTISVSNTNVVKQDC